MSPQEPQNASPGPDELQSESSRPEEPQLFSNSSVDTEPSTQPKPQPESGATPSPNVDPLGPKPAGEDSSSSTTENSTPAAPTSLEAEISSSEFVAVPFPGETTSGTVPPAAPRKSRKKLVAIIIVAVIVLLALGGGVAFAVWNNSPQKVLNDSLGNLLNTPPTSADVTAVVSVDDTNIKIAVATYGDGSDNTQANVKFDVTSGNTAVNANIDAIAAKNGDLYIRLNDAKKLVAQFTEGSPEAAAMFEGVLTKVDTKWVKITAEDLKSLTGGEKSPNSECVSKAVTAFQNDDTQQKEVKDLYAKNQFITVKEQKADEVIAGRNSFHYVLNADEAKAKSFAESMKQSAIYKKIKDCLGDSFKDTDATSSSKDSDDSTVSSVEVWIDKSTRKITKLALAASSAENESDAKVDAILGYETKSITLPKETTSLDEVQKELQDMFGGSATPASNTLGASILMQ